LQDDTASHGYQQRKIGKPGHVSQAINIGLRGLFFPRERWYQVPMNDSGFRVERRGGAALFVICRGSSANALSREVLLGLGRFAREVETWSDVRVALVTGQGDRYFCAGADLKERAGWSEREIVHQLGLYRSELGALDQCSKPVVAVLNGVALGGGLEIALACDLRVAAPHVRLGQPETRLAIIPGAGGTQRLPRLIGEGRAKQMILLGESIDAPTALAWGLVNRVSPPGVDVLDDTLAWVEPILQGAPLAQSAALRAVDGGRDVPLEVGLDVEWAAYDRVLHSEDRLEGLRAFADKRAPRYQGR